MKKKVIAVAGILLLTWVGGQGAEMNQRRAITAGPAPIGPYSPAIVAGGLVYVSGMLGPDVVSQTKRILDRLKEILEASGSSLAQTVSVSVFLKNPADFEALNATYLEYFKESPPTRTTVCSSSTSGSAN